MTRSQRPIWLGEDRRGWDHARVHLQLLTDPRLDPRSSAPRQGPNRSHVLAVYLGLAAHAETQTGDTRPAQSTLARYAGCSVKTVARCIDVLAAVGYVEVEERPGTASLYRLLPPPTLDPQSEVAAADPGPTVRPTPDSGSRTPDPESDELEIELEPENYGAPSADAASMPAEERAVPVDPARELVKAFWDYRKREGLPTPTLPARGRDGAFMALVGIVRALLAADWPVAEVKRALMDTPAYTTNALTLTLNRNRERHRQQTGAVNYDPPSDRLI